MRKALGHILITGTVAGIASMQVARELMGFAIIATNFPLDTQAWRRAQSAHHVIDDRRGNRACQGSSEGCGRCAY